MIVKKIVNRTVNSWMRKKSFIALLLQLSATRLWLVVEFHHQGYHIHILVLLCVIELQAVRSSAAFVQRCQHSMKAAGALRPYSE
jgi:hypothetical protein